MKVRRIDVSTGEWHDVYEGSWVRIETASGTFDINEASNIIPDGFAGLRATDDGVLELRPLASNTAAIRSVRS